LTLSEREEISRGLVARRSIRSIARKLCRSPSTVSREIGRNGGRARYRAARADAQAWARARRPKQCKLATHAWLRQAVARQLRLNWSPEQIAGWLKRTYPGQEAYQVSHETIYRSLFVQARGVLKKELSALAAHDAPLPARKRERRWARAHQGHDLDPRAPGLG
jgi:IS30 family transposase